MSSHFCVTAHGRAACDADHQERGGCCTPWPELVAICIAIPGHIVQIVLYNGITARSTMQTRHGQERFHMPATAGLFICKQAQDKQSSHFRTIKDRPAKDPRSAHSKTHFRKICSLHFRKRKRSGLHFIKGATTWCSTWMQKGVGYYPTPEHVESVVEIIHVTPRPGEAVEFNDSLDRQARNSFKSSKASAGGRTSRRRYCRPSAVRSTMARSTNSLRNNA